MKKVLFVMALLLSTAACAPVTITKETIQYKYEGDKLISTYRESITQTPEKTLPIHLKHQELYE